MVRKVGKARRKVSGTRKHTKRRTTRRRKISGANDMTGMLEKAGGLIVGAVAGREFNTLAVQMFPSLTPMMSGLAQMAIGFVLPKLAKGSFVQAVGDGMIANGGMVTIVSTGIISGPSNAQAYHINGTSNLKVISGTSRLPIVAGPTTRISNVPNNVPGAKVKTFQTFV